MLPAAHRLRRSVDFERAVRRGVRAGRTTVVVHLAQDAQGDDRPQVGFVVSRAVGGAVHRNRVKRRLRAAVVSELGQLPMRSRVVIRALPAAASADFSHLSRDVGEGMALAVRRSTRSKTARS